MAIEGRALRFGGMVGLVLGCSTSRPPDAGNAMPPAPSQRPLPSENASARPLATDAGTVTPPDAGLDPCGWDEAFRAAHRALDPAPPMDEWLDRCRTALLPRTDAQRALGGITQEVVSALDHDKIERLADFVDKTGLCVRLQRGAPCRRLSSTELAACRRSRKKEAWPVAAGASPPSLSCAEALGTVVYARDFLRADKVTYNCFDDEDRAGGPPLIQADPALGYVELRSARTKEASSDSRSLWLVFTGVQEGPVLTEIVGDYQGD